MSWYTSNLSKVGRSRCLWSVNRVSPVQQHRSIVIRHQIQDQTLLADPLQLHILRVRLEHADYLHDSLVVVLGVEDLVQPTVSLLVIEELNELGS